MSDWSEQEISGGWYERQAMDSCRLRVDQNFKTWHNRAAARIEVDPGDDPLELSQGSERAEVLIAQDNRGEPILDDASAGTQYYATSFYFPVEWEGTQYPWSAFAPKDCSSGDQNQCNSWSIVLQFHMASSKPWGFLSAAKYAPNGIQQYSLSLGKSPIPFSDGGAIALGKWTDFIFEFRWGVGTMSVWRRDQGQSKFAQVIDGASFIQPSEKVYLKQGLYRGAAVGGRVDLLWIGPTARGDTFSAVEQAAFGERK